MTNWPNLIPHRHLESSPMTLWTLKLNDFFPKPNLQNWLCFSIDWSSNLEIRGISVLFSFYSGCFSVWLKFRRNMLILIRTDQINWLTCMWQLNERVSLELLRITSKRPQQSFRLSFQFSKHHLQLVNCLAFVFCLVSVDSFCHRFKNNIFWLRLELGSKFNFTGRQFLLPIKLSTCCKRIWKFIFGAKICHCRKFNKKGRKKKKTKLPMNNHC